MGFNSEFKGLIPNKTWLLLTATGACSLPLLLSATTATNLYSRITGKYSQSEISPVAVELLYTLCNVTEIMGRVA